MKSMITFFFLLSFQLNSQAQIYVEGKALDEVYTGKYLLVDCPNLRRKVRANYGNTRNNLSTFQILQDKIGEPLRFNNTVSMLNFFDKNGWEAISSMGDNDNFILKRKE